MKNGVSLLVFLLIFIFLPTGCTSSPAAEQTETPLCQVSSAAAVTFDEVVNKEWILVELRTESGYTAIDRDKLAANSFGGAFTVRFDSEHISGAGAPNRFRAPYTLADNQAISIGMIAGTLMAAIFELEELKEHEYFSFLQNVSRWDLVMGNLELFSVDTVLVFSLVE